MLGNGDIFLHKNKYTNAYGLYGEHPYCSCCLLEYLDTFKVSKVAILFYFERHDRKHTCVLRWS